MISALFFVWFLFASVWTINALRRPAPPGARMAPLWLAGMLVSELAPPLFLVRGLIASAFVMAGSHGPLARLAVGLFLFSEAGLLVIICRTVVSAKQTRHSPSLLTLLRVWEGVPIGVMVRKRVHTWNGLTTDVYARAGLTQAPTLLYLHPGSWMRGAPGRQARSLLYGLADQGWVVLDIRYPLSPQATFPDHLVGVREAIAWAKADTTALGIDPRRMAIAGGSAGAHLAALAALTSNHGYFGDLQGADYGVAACVGFYGIYDLLVRNPTRDDWPFVARQVMKATPHAAPDLYRLGSPIDQVHPDAPPFLVVHGEFDSVVLAEESRHFVDALSSVGGPVTYHEVAAAQHGFDAIASLRSRAVATMTQAWLDEIVGPRAEARPGGATPPPASPLSPSSPGR